MAKEWVTHGETAKKEGAHVKTCEWICMIIRKGVRPLWSFFLIDQRAYELLVRFGTSIIASVISRRRLLVRPNYLDLIRIPFRISNPGIESTAHSHHRHFRYWTSTAKNTYRGYCTVLMAKTVTLFQVSLHSTKLDTAIYWYNSALCHSHLAWLSFPYIRQITQTVSRTAFFTPPPAGTLIGSTQA